MDYVAYLRRTQAKSLASCPGYAPTKQLPASGEHCRGGCPTVLAQTQSGLWHIRRRFVAAVFHHVVSTVVCTLRQVKTASSSAHSKLTEAAPSLHRSAAYSELRR